ncbi:signal recognition particle subunit SRP68 [Magallana gigas]|uniref:Signal recognition particle subunit SRP68 n=2 Tax=Magallana gigas TaxID=29159 RepID=A0A8W8MLS8_MAGGI|nr:signal recognition particle subunit SRP68 [Crassostrea gigas]|eukprot:XP_011455290.1 PREDICTED: signal recognition particle subunit SRP68 [Crassostrea gigas]
MAAPAESMTEENPEDVPLEKTYTVEVLQLVREAQQQHGLRHGDFQRYRSYCSRRIRRIRKSLHFPQGNKHKVQPKKITVEKLTDVRYLHLPLFCAERAWYYAMQLKSEANTEPRKRFHMLARVRKALVYAEEFTGLCESSKCDARTKLESQAYLSLMKGGLYFEQEDWKAAMEYYTKAKTIYEKLGSAFSEDIQQLYLQQVEEITPNLRYCAYNIGDQSAIDELRQLRRKGGEDQLTSHLDDLLSQTREKQTATLSEVKWQGRTVQVKNEPVRLFLLNLQDSTKEIESAEGIDSKISIYESLLKQCIDAQQVLRDTLQDDQNFKLAIRGQEIEGKISNQHYLHTYLTFIRLSKTVERNLLLIETMKDYLPGKKVEEGHKITKPQDLVRLYDIIIQNLNEIPNLTGLDVGGSLSEETAVRVLGFKAFRSYYIAQSYLGAKKWKETISLYERVLQNAQSALKGYRSLPKPQQAQFKVEMSNLEDLIHTVDGEKYSCHATSVLDINHVTDQMGAITVNPKMPLIERLEDYAEDSSLTSKKPNLVSFPPDFEPIPCRPLFFDLALNHIDLPSLEEHLEQKQKAANPKGLTGFVKGWLWGGSK